LDQARIICILLRASSVNRGGKGAQLSASRQARGNCSARIAGNLAIARLRDGGAIA
jgi:hypothetical protein